MVLPRTGEMDDLSDVAGSAGVAGRTNINFVNPRAEVEAGIWTLFVGATAFLGLRLWCKVNRRTGLWWDDHILVASWVVLLAANIFISVEFATGYVQKSWDDRMLILVTISSCLITVGQTLSKTAFAVTLLRITERWQRWILWFIIVTLNVYLVVVLLINWTNYCGQTQYWWRMPGVCAPYETIFGLKIGQNIYNIVLDFVLSLFPWVLMWNLNIAKYEKIGLCVTMSLGVLIAIFTSVRTWYMLDSGLNVYNAWYFWRQGMSEIWYQAEVAGTIIVQTLPVIRLLVQDLQVSLMPMQLNETPHVLTIGTGTNKTARNSRAWAAANNPHSLSDVDDLECGRGSGGDDDDNNNGGHGGGGGVSARGEEEHRLRDTRSLERFEMHELGKTSTEGPRDQRGYVVEMGYAL
ncbi:hypothetical protein VP1G_10034 [Cytospora mali]|uniref:Rhodopsin domain-containing protein n=1 Tax=Cytospora mali TaxID=578113 RepID=A0A194VGA7_CYTMA|nr:hypothetical protein VP1G_10034 [Valsa mali var. pyri (nom. inval.)]